MPVGAIAQWQRTAGLSKTPREFNFQQHQLPFDTFVVSVQTLWVHCLLLHRCMYQSWTIKQSLPLYSRSCCNLARVIIVHQHIYLLYTTATHFVHGGQMLMINIKFPLSKCKYGLNKTHLYMLAITHYNLQGKICETKITGKISLLVLNNLGIDLSSPAQSCSNSGKRAGFILD